MVPYSIQRGSTDNARDIGLLLAAAGVIDAHCRQPILRRHATMRFDVFDGQGMLPCPLHQHVGSRRNGEALEASDFGISGGLFQYAGTRPATRDAVRDTVEIDGVMGWGSFVDTTGYTAVANTLTPPEGGAALPLGSVIYDNGTLVFVEAIDSSGVMTLSAQLTDESGIDLIVPPPQVRRASDALIRLLAATTSNAQIEESATPQVDDLLTAEVRRLLAPFQAAGGASSYAPVSGSAGFPQTGDAFGPGFGRGFD